MNGELFLQVNRPLAMRKDVPQRRKRKPKKPILSPLPVPYGKLYASSDVFSFYT